MSKKQEKQVRSVQLSFVPFRQQCEVILGAQKTPITAAIAGARGGKTEVGRWIFADWALTQPGYLDIDREAGKPYCMAAWAPTYPMLTQVVEPAILSAIPDALLVDHRLTPPKTLPMRSIHGTTKIYSLSGHETDWSRG